MINLLQKCTLPIWLALFLVTGSGCAEQEQKSKETGQAIIDTVKGAEKNVDDAVLKMRENANKLEEVEK